MPKIVYYTSQASLKMREIRQCGLIFVLSSTVNYLMLLSVAVGIGLMVCYRLEIRSYYLPWNSAPKCLLKFSQFSDLFHLFL